MADQWTFESSIYEWGDNKRRLTSPSRQWTAMNFFLCPQLVACPACWSQIYCRALSGRMKESTRSNNNLTWLMDTFFNVVEPLDYIQEIRDLSPDVANDATS